MSRYNNPVPQMLNDDGSPAISGKLYFYQTGTLTAQDTYADAGFTIPNTNPVVIDASGRVPNIFLNGSYKVIFVDADGQQQWERDPVGGTSGEQWADWKSTVTYQVSDIVRGSDLQYYISEVNGNLGNDPVTSPTQWGVLTLTTTYYVNDMDGLVNISNRTDGQRATIIGFFATFPQSTFKGGGEFIWQANLNKNQANGGNIVDPDTIGGFNGSIATRDAFLAAQGTGVGLGCWVRTSTTLTAGMFGAVGDDVTDDTAAVQAAIDYSSNRSLLYLGDGTFRFNVTLKDGSSCLGEGRRATICKPVDGVDEPVFNIIRTETNINWVRIEDLSIEGDVTTPSGNQHGIFIETALIGEQPLLTVSLFNNWVVKNVVIRLMGGRGIHMRGQPDALNSSIRGGQSMTFQNVVVFGCEKSGLFVKGNVLECVYLNCRISGNGSSTSAQVAATRADKRNSNIVFTADNVETITTGSIGQFSLPSRHRFVGLVTSEAAAKGASNEGVTVYIDGGRQISFVSWDAESIYRGMEIDTMDTAAAGVNTTWDVSLNVVNCEVGPVTLQEFAVLNSCRKFIYSDIHIFGDTETATGVDITTTDYGKVGNVINKGGNSFQVLVDVNDARVREVAGPPVAPATTPLEGSFTIYQEGQMTMIGDGGAADTFEGPFYYAEGVYSPNQGSTITFKNGLSGQPVLWDRALLAANEIYINDNFILDADADSITLQFEAVQGATNGAWYEIARTKEPEFFTVTTTGTGIDIDVAGKYQIYFGPTVATTVSTLSGGVRGQKVVIRTTTANATFNHGAGGNNDLLLNSNANYAANSGAFIQLEYMGDGWAEIGRKA